MAWAEWLSSAAADGAIESCRRSISLRCLLHGHSSLEQGARGVSSLCVTKHLTGVAQRIALRV